MGGMMKKVAKSFMWRMQGGERIYPKNMTTHHLFYTLKMIWNHTVPEHKQIKPFKQYNINWSFYTPEYLANAIRVLSAELGTRENIELYLHPLSIIQKHMEAIDGKATNRHQIEDRTKD